MKVLGISGDEQRAFWLILGAIYHLGAAGATKGKIAHQMIFPSIASSLICMENVNHNITHTSDKDGSPLICAFDSILYDEIA